MRERAKTETERRKYDSGGRFAGKGGQQVGSAFAESTVNEKIEAIYGNYCLWSWFRYMFIDSVEYTAMLLMDKGYYDYDYEQPKPKPARALTYDESAMSDSEMESVLARFGWGNGTVKPDKPTPEQVQQILINEKTTE